MNDIKFPYKKAIIETIILICVFVIVLPIFKMSTSTVVKNIQKINTIFFIIWASLFFLSILTVWISKIIKYKKDKNTKIK